MNACIRSVCKALSIVLKEDVKTLSVLFEVNTNYNRKGRCAERLVRGAVRNWLWAPVLCLSRAVSSLQDYPIQQYPNVFLDRGIRRL